MSEEQRQRPVDERRATDEQRDRPAPVDRTPPIEVEKLAIDEHLAVVDAAPCPVDQVFRPEAQRDRVLRREPRMIEVMRVVSEQDVETRAHIRPVWVGVDPPGLVHRLHKNDCKSNC